MRWPDQGVRAPENGEGLFPLATVLFRLRPAFLRDAKIADFLEIVACADPVSCVRSRFEKHLFETAVLIVQFRRTVFPPLMPIAERFPYG